MNKMITTTILAAVSAFAFANEPLTKLSDFSLDPKAPRATVGTAKPGFAYFRLAAADSYLTDSLHVVPGLGVGYRLMIGSGALDVSAHYNSSKGWVNRADKESESSSFFWMLPKASYVQYLNPSYDQSVYYVGAGLGWGGLQTKDDRSFTGIIPSATVGVEFFRKSAVRTFAELNISQPAIAQAVSATFPGPVAELSVGAGF